VSESDDHLDLVRRVVAAEDEVRGLSQQAVNAGSAAGDSWEAIGSCLGMSRQAVQQRFGRERRTDSDDGGDRIRWIGPVAALDQMAELEIAGRLGWRIVGTTMFYRQVERTRTLWEHRRVLSTRAASLTRDGWEVGCDGVPWVYLVRETGQICLSGPPRGATRPATRRHSTPHQAPLDPPRGATQPSGGLQMTVSEGV
jgi:hypothetical protein